MTFNCEIRSDPDPQITVSDASGNGGGHEREHCIQWRPLGHDDVSPIAFFTPVRIDFGPGRPTAAPEGCLPYERRLPGLTHTTLIQPPVASSSPVRPLTTHKTDPIDGRRRRPRSRPPSTRNSKICSVAPN